MTYIYCPVGAPLFRPVLTTGIQMMKIRNFLFAGVVNRELLVSYLFTKRGTLLAGVDDNGRALESLTVPSLIFKFSFHGSA